MPSAIIIGVGPGIGLSVAQRFAREGFSIGVIARSQTTLDAARDALADAGVETATSSADAGDAEALRGALDRITDQLGIPDVLVYNAGLIQMDEVGELTSNQHFDSWAINVGGVLTAAAHVLPRMAETGHGSFLITGGMPTPYPGMVSLSLGKAAVRALTELLEIQFAPQGVHVATVTVGGRVEPGGSFDPNEIADVYWELHTQWPGAWEREVSYGAKTVSSRAA